MEIKINKEIKAKTEELANAEERLNERQIDLKQKRAELSEMSKIPHPVEFEKYYNL